MKDSIGIHVIGGGFGESVIVELPDGTYGVVDCCCSRLKCDNLDQEIESNPSLRLLVQEKNAGSLAFVAVTHPHEDHARGVSHILKHYENRIDQIWIFETFQERYLSNCLRALQKREKLLPVEQLLNERPGTFSRELNWLRNYVIRICCKKKLSQLHFFSDIRTDSLPCGVKVHFLGPVVSRVTNYRAKSIDRVVQIAEDGTGKLNRDWKPYPLKHNELSPALLIEYGQTRLLLGGDVEAEAWQELLEQRDGSLSCQFYKIPHHGSVNGFCDGLLERIAEGGSPVAVLTPFNRHWKPLPTVDGLDEYRKHFDAIYATNVRQARYSCGARPEALPADVIKKWMELVKKHPEWWGVLDPEFFPAAATHLPLEELSHALLSELDGMSALAEALRPDLLKLLPTAADVEQAADRHRLSFYFNSAGEELRDRRTIGAGAGPI